MNPKELSHLNEMLDQIQSLSILDGKTWVYDKIELKANDREIYIPPTTHLVTTIDDLTDVLDYDVVTDMDEDVDGLAETTLPQTNTGKWTTTSTYNVYMVNTPKSPPRRRCRHRRGMTGDTARNNATADNGTATADDAGNPEEVL
jgi:hypothetical protein